MTLEQARNRAQAGLRLQESKEAPHLSKFHQPKRPLHPRMRRSASNVAVNDLADHGLDLPVDSDAYNSIGGLVFAELGRLPRRGDTVHADGFSIRVESVRDNRIEAVRIRERRA